ncbi:MAG: GntR family transcriptional regulator [Clostridiales bacterium]|nr:GntR family transcriptional regulator [Clostridiales bacterium]
MNSLNDNISIKSNFSKQHVAYEKIKDAIIKDELLPDTLLVERELCKNLGFSRTPVREALNRLALEGLVEFIPNKGMFVSKIRFEDMLEIYELREALEGMAIRLFTLRKDNEILRQMEECLVDQCRALEAADYARCVERDMDFHDLFVRGSRNNRLINFIKTVHDQNSRVAFFTVNDLERLKTSHEQHQRVFEAIGNNDAELAEKLIKEHIVNIKQYHIGKLYMTR